MDQKDLIIQDFGLDDLILSHLRESGKWCRFLGITGFVFSGLFVLIAVFGTSSISAALPESMYGLEYVVIAFYILIAIISTLFSLFLLRFGSNIKVALEGNNQESLATAFSNLRLFFRMSGIITVLYVLFILLFFVGTIVSAVIR